MPVPDMTRKEARDIASVILELMTLNLPEDDWKKVASAKLTECAVFDMVQEERSRQDAKFGPLPRLDLSNDDWWAVLNEEVAESYEALAAGRVGGEMEKDSLEAELVQVAAVAIAWLTDLGTRYVIDRVEK